jgi:PAS domain S-box-containing protein
MNMALIKSSTSVPVFLAKFLFTPLLILLSVLLLWIYVESEQYVNRQQDLSIEFNTRNSVRELDSVQQHLVSILDVTALEISKSSGQNFLDPEVIEDVLTQRSINEFCFLMFVPSNIDQDVVVNDDPFFDFNKSREIFKNGPDVLLDAWHLINVGLPDNPIWTMASGKLVADDHTGLVLGMLVGGVVLNDNQSLTHAIQYRSVKALFTALEIEGRIVAANYPLSVTVGDALKSQTSAVTLKVRDVLKLQTNAGNRSMLTTENGVDRPVIISRFSYPFASSTDLNIILVYQDHIYTELQKSILRSGGVVLFGTVVLFLAFALLARKKLEASLENLLHYTEIAAATPSEAVYFPGTFQEFNRIGKAVEKTIAMLNKTTEELQDSKERLELTIEGAALGTWEWNIESGKVDYNKRWAEMLGYTLDEVKTDISNWKNCLHPDEKEEILEKLIDHLDGQTSMYQSEHRLQNKSGQWIWVVDAGRVYKYDDSGNPLRAVGIHLDITRRKEAEQALAKERALLLSLINSIPDLIFYKNDEGVYLGCNKAFEEFTGKTEQEIVNKTDLDLFPLDVAECSREQDNLMLALGQSSRKDEWVTYPDGRKVLLDTLKFPFVGLNNELLGLVGVSRDVTHKKKMEEELMKIEKLQSLAVLAGGIAHDFNNILTAVLGNIELANYRFGRKNKDAADLLDEATKATKRAVKLTRQLLTFAKGDELIRDATDLSVLIRETAEFVLHGSTVVCKYEFPEKLWMADADSGQISQVIQNIVINAKHAMEDGGTICIHCENVDELMGTSQESLHSGGFVKIVITDTGSGIPEEYIDNIFDPYFTTKQKGSGLGLRYLIQLLPNIRG